MTISVWLCGPHPSPHQHPAGQNLHLFAVLIPRNASHRDHPALRPGAGRLDLQHFAFDLQDIPFVKHALDKYAPQSQKAKNQDVP